MWILISPHHHVLVSPSDSSRYLCIMSDEEMETEQQQAAVIGRLHELRKQRGFVKRSVTGLAHQESEQTRGRSRCARNQGRSEKTTRETGQPG